MYLAQEDRVIWTEELNTRTWVLCSPAIQKFLNLAGIVEMLRWFPGAFTDIPPTNHS